MRLGDIVIGFGIVSIILSQILIPLNNVGVELIPPALMEQYKINLTNYDSEYFSRDSSALSSLEGNLSDPEGQLIEKKDPGSGTFGVYDASLLLLGQVVRLIRSLLLGPFLIMAVINSIVEIALADIPILRDFVLVAYQILIYVLFVVILFAIIRLIFGRDDKI